MVEYENQTIPGGIPMDSMSQTDIFTTALGLGEPWSVKSVEFVPSAKNEQVREVHITVDFREGSTFPCPECGTACAVHDTKQKTWRHLNFFQYRCYIHARVPRVACPEHKVKLVAVPWARAGSGFTVLMEAVLLTMMQKMPVAEVARQTGEHDTRLWRLLRAYVDEALRGQDFSGVDALGVDEYSHEGQNYITVFLAHPETGGAKARVLFSTQGKDRETVRRFVGAFTAKRGNPDAVRDITCDMCHGYRNALREAFPLARTTVDKFYVVKMLGDAVDRVRRREMRSADRKKTRDLDGTRYLWLTNREKLSDVRRAQLELLMNTDHLETVTAYGYRLKLQGLYENCLDYDSAVESFEALCLEMANSGITEIRAVATSLTRNAEEILNYFVSRKTNALLEGFNSVISLIKRRARGFRNMDNFMAMIYFVCGGLQLPTATIM